MPNIKSAIKRVKIIEKKSLKNNMTKSEYRTAVKKFEKAVADKDLKQVKPLFAEATKKIDQACSKNIIKKNTASNKKSRLAKMLNTLDAKNKTKK